MDVVGAVPDDVTRLTVLDRLGDVRQTITRADRLSRRITASGMAKPVAPRVACSAVVELSTARRAQKHTTLQAIRSDVA